MPVSAPIFVRSPAAFAGGTPDLVAVHSSEAPAGRRTSSLIGALAGAGTAFAAIFTSAFELSAAVALLTLTPRLAVTTVIVAFVFIATSAAIIFILIVLIPGIRLLIIVVVLIFIIVVIIIFVIVLFIFQIKGRGLIVVVVLFFIIIIPDIIIFFILSSTVGSLTATLSDPSAFFWFHRRKATSA